MLTSVPATGERHPAVVTRSRYEALLWPGRLSVLSGDESKGGVSAPICENACAI